MPARFPVLADHASPQRRFGDWVIGSLGVSVATLSASFAAYMLVVRPGDSGVPTGNGFNVFAAFDRRPRFMAATPVLPDLPRPAEGVAEPRSDIDFTPTGSIAPKATAAPAHATLARDGQGDLPLPNFVIRDVFDGRALIETGNRLRLVEPGSLLDGAGAVLAIKRSDRGWVVETTGGRIE